MEKKNAFTLVELLAVVVVLSFILVIGVPKIVDTMNKSKNKTLESTVRLIVSSAESKYMEYQTKGIEDEIKCSDVAEINDEDYKHCGISFDKDGKAKVTIVGKGKFEGKYVCEGTKKEVVTHDSICDGPIPTDILQELFEFKYYSSLLNAVTDVNNNEIGVNADATKENAVAGIYTNNNKKYVVLLKDTTETTKIVPSTDMTINLGGNTLTFEQTYLGVSTDKTHTDSIIIDGRIPNSNIVLNGIDGGGRIFQVYSNTLIIKGGSYKLNEKVGNEQYGALGISVIEDGNVIIDSIDLIVHLSNNPDCNCGKVSGIDNKGEITIDDSNIIVYLNSSSDGIPKSKYSRSILNSGTAIINNSSLVAYSNLDSNEYSSGILNAGTLIINDSYVLGTREAIGNGGILYLNGGTYESYNSGGIYFIGTETTSYVKNATLRYADMPLGYMSNINGSKSGFVIGGNLSANNNSIYMNNCDIYGNDKSMYLRGESGEQNNSLYISNSRIHGSGVIDISNDTHKLYIGRGNNFTAANTNRESSVTVTDEVYIQSE